MKRIISLLLVFFVLISIPLNAHAAELVLEDYVRFIPSNERITPSGSFTFLFSSNMTSETFWPISGHITIETSAYLYNRDTGSTYAANDAYYIINIINENTGRSVGYFKQAANGESITRTFSVSTGVGYHLQFTTGGFIEEYEKISGTGDLSNIYVN